MDIKVGTVCISKKGHDKGDKVVIVSVINESYVLICDGKNRSTDLPKMKNIKHLKLIAYDEDLNNSINNNTISDEEIVSKISKL